MYILDNTIKNAAQQLINSIKAMRCKYFCCLLFEKKVIVDIFFAHGDLLVTNAVAR